MQFSLDDKLITAVFAGIGVVIAAVGTAIGAARGRQDRESPPITDASLVTLSSPMLRQMLDIASDNQATMMATLARMEANERFFAEGVARIDAAMISIRALVEVIVKRTDD